MTWLLDYIAIMLLTALSAVVVVWFYVMRRRMIVMMKSVTAELEKYFNPVDKTYRLLGYLVGYTANYVLRSGDNVYILFTTVPRHSFTYYFIAKLIGRVDLLRVAVKGARRYVARDFHLVLGSSKRWYDILLRDLKEDVHRLSKTSIGIRNRAYVAFYEDPRDLERVQKVLESSDVTTFKLSAYSREGLVEVVAEVSSSNVPKILELLEKFSRLITRGLERRV